jgi:choline-sulfatase
MVAGSARRRRSGSFRTQRGSRGRNSRAHPAVFGLLALFLVSGCIGAGDASPERVVLITIDTLRADHLGCYGASRAKTPHLDGLAAAGVRFAVAVSPAPLTLPSHASLMTALDPPQHGVRHNSIHRLGDDLPTLAERMRASGYATAAVIGAVVLDRRFGLARGFDVYDDHISGRISARVGFAERTANQVVDAALDWLRDAPDRFFLWVHFYDPHARYAPPPGFASGFADHLYAGEIAFVDAQVGRLLDSVRDRWGEAGLLVVATSDHGESLGEHEPTHGYSVYDATQRIPLLLAGPGLPRGHTVETAVRLVDVAPTVLALTGATPLAEVKGRDLRPLIDGSERGDRSAYVETLATQFDFHWSPLLGLRTAAHKYVRAPRPELYDLVADPGERDNLAPLRGALLAKLDRELEQHLLDARIPLGDVALPEDERERLESLGYVVPEDTFASFEIGRVGGPDPKDERAVLDLLRRAESFLTQRRPRDALEVLDRIERPGPAVLGVRGAAALAAGEPERAEREARTLLAEQPGRKDIRVLLGRSLEAQGRPEEALLEFENGLRIAPRAAGPLLGRGRALEQLGRLEEAMEAYRGVLELESQRGEAAWRLAALWIEVGRFAEAEALLEEQGPQDPAAALRLARAEVSAGRPERALERLDAAFQRHPGEASLAQARGHLLEASGRLEPALEAQETALRLAPRHAVTQQEVARLLARLGRDLDRALELAESAVDVSAESPDAVATLARVRLARGEAGQALALTERALDAAPPERREELEALRAAARSGRGLGQSPQGVADPR